MRASKSYTLSHWVCWATFQLLGYRWQLDPRSESRNLSLHRHKKHSTRSVWKGQSASIWVYLNFAAQAKSSSSSEVVKIMSLPATSLQVTAHGFRTSTRFWRFYLPGLMAPAARPDESKSVQVTKLSNQCGTEMLFWKIFHIVSKVSSKYNVRKKNKAMVKYKVKFFVDHQNAESTKDYKTFQEMWPSQGGRTEELWQFLSRRVFFTNQQVEFKKQKSQLIEKELQDWWEGMGVVLGLANRLWFWLDMTKTVATYNECILLCHISKWCFGSNSRMQAHFIRAKHEKDEDDCVNVGVQNCLCFEYARLTNIQLIDSASRLEVRQVKFSVGVKLMPNQQLFAAKSWCFFKGPEPTSKSKKEFAWGMEQGFTVNGAIGITAKQSKIQEDRSHAIILFSRDSFGKGPPQHCILQRPFLVKPKRKVDESCWNMQISARRYKQQLLQTWEELSIVPLVKLVLVTDRCNALHNIYWWKDIDHKNRCEMERYIGYIPVKSTIVPQTDTLFSWFHGVCSSTKWMVVWVAVPWKREICEASQHRIRQWCIQLFTLVLWARGDDDRVDKDHFGVQ